MRRHQKIFRPAIPYHKIHENDCEKRKVYRLVFRVTFFCDLHSFFPFLRQGLHLSEKSEDFVVYFFAAIIKHGTCMIFKKCIESVSYFVVCFAKYPGNAKYEKCIAGLTKFLPFPTLYKIIVSFSYKQRYKICLVPAKKLIAHLSWQ